MDGHSSLVAREHRNAQSFCMDARLLGVAVPDTSLGSFVYRSPAPLAITAIVRSCLEPPFHHSCVLHCYLSVVITLSHLTKRWSEPLTGAKIYFR